MNTIWAVSLSCTLIFVGCIAGPTPHPSNSDNMSEFAEDASRGANAPPPTVGSQDDCESSGGAWDGTECTDSLEPSADAGSLSDGEGGGDTVEDTGPSSDADSDGANDVVEEEANADAAEATD